jgi:23S rRNA (adenine2030-N6)-methyltransferase
MEALQLMGLKTRDQRDPFCVVEPPPPLRTDGHACRASGGGLRRFALGVFVVWYPLKADRTAETVLEGIAELKIPGTLKVELRVREAFSGGGLAGSGLAIVNAPWRLDEELSVLVPQLAARLGLGSWGKAAVEWINAPT